MDATIERNTVAKAVLKAVIFCGAFTGLFFLLSSIINFAPLGFGRLAQGIIGTISALLVISLFLKIEKRRFADIGLRFEGKTLLKFFTGVLIGLLLMGFLAMSVVYISNLSVEINPSSNVFNFFLVTAPLIPLALMEELAFRSYPLEVLRRATGTRSAIIITSILFALYHVASGWSVSSSFYGPAVWGLLFGLTAVYSKGIAMPTGFHYAANLTTSALGEVNSSMSIWVVKQPDTATTTGIDWATLFPVIVLLVLSIICSELFVRNKVGPNRGFKKASAEIT